MPKEQFHYTLHNKSWLKENIKVVQNTLMRRPKRVVQKENKKLR